MVGKRINMYLSNTDVLSQFDSYCKSIGRSRSSMILELMRDKINYTAPVKPEPLPEWMQ